MVSSAKGNEKNRSVTLPVIARDSVRIISNCLRSQFRRKGFSGRRMLKKIKGRTCVAPKTMCNYRSTWRNNRFYRIITVIAYISASANSSSGTSSYGGLYGCCTCHAMFHNFITLVEYKIIIIKIIVISINSVADRLSTRSVYNGFHIALSSYTIYLSS